MPGKLGVEGVRRMRNWRNAVRVGGERRKQKAESRKMGKCEEERRKQENGESERSGSGQRRSMVTGGLKRRAEGRPERRAERAGWWVLG